MHTNYLSCVAIATIIATSAGCFDGKVLPNPTSAESKSSLHAHLPDAKTTQTISLRVPVPTTQTPGKLDVPSAPEKVMVEERPKTFESEYDFVEIAPLQRSVGAANTTNRSVSDHGMQNSKKPAPSNPPQGELKTLEGKSREEIQHLAEAGHAEAQQRYALILLSEVDDPTSKTKLEPVIHWLTASAKQDYEPAGLGLANAYVIGLGVEQDYRQAEQWYRRFLTTSTGSAETGLGMLKLREEQYQQAAEWFEKGVDKGNRTAQLQLGRMLLEGVVGPDHGRAEDLFQLAAEQGCDESMAVLGEMHFRQLARNASPEDGKSWYIKAAAKGNAFANYNLGVIAHREGELPTAARYFRDAANKGHVDAMLNLAVMLFHIGDYDGSEAWLKKAASLGSSEAVFKLGVVRRQGDLVNRTFDYEEQ